MGHTGARVLRTGRRGRHLASKRGEPAWSPALQPLVHERRSRRPVDRLTRRIDEQCTTAVDSLQIAATLESIGLNDQSVRTQYGFDDVFELAEHIYRQVPARPDAGIDRTPPKTTTHDMIRLLLRGLLFMAPGLLYAALGSATATTGAVLAILIGVTFGWAWGQGQAYLGHVFLGRLQPAAARVVTRRVAMLGLLAASALALLALGLGWGLFATGLLLGQAGYFLAASILLMLEKEFLLAWALLPGVIFVAMGQMGLMRQSSTVQLTVATLTVAAVIVAAWWATRLTEPAPHFEVSRRDVRDAIPHAVLGIVWAGVVMMGGLTWMDGEAQRPSLGLELVPVLLSMGVAEVVLRRYIAGSRMALEAATDFVGFARLTARVFYRHLAEYAAALVALTLVVGWVLVDRSGMPGRVTLLLGAYTAMGIAFYSGMVLVSRSRVLLVTNVSLLAFSGTAAIAALVGSSLATSRLEVIYLAGTLALSAVLAVFAAKASGQVAGYR